MDRRAIIAVAVLSVVVMSAIVVGASYAFTGETYNSENNYTAEPTTITVRSTNNVDNDNNLMEVSLPAPQTGDGYTGNGPWTLSYTSGVTSGYLEIRCPEGADGQGYMRTWLEVKYPEVWSIIQRVTLRIDGNSTEYVLFGADSELLEVGGEPNRKLIPVTTHVGNGNLLGFRLIVTYKSELTVNPQSILGDDYTGQSRLQIVQQILKSRLVFAMAEDDPVNTIKVNYVCRGQTLETVEAYRGNVLLPPNFTGYNIDGWFMTDPEDPGFDPESEWDFPSYHVDERYWEKYGFDPKTKVFNLYARETSVPTTYTIGYDLDGGSVVSPNRTEYTVETASFVLTNPTREGYTFAGWTGTGLTEKTTSVTVEKGSTGNRFYTANWTGTTYKIVFNKNGGIGDDIPAIDNVVWGTPTVLPNNTYTYEGYTFVGWDGNNDNRVDYFDGASVYSPVSLTNGVMTLKAIWSNADVTFDANGGTGAMEPVRRFNGYVLPDCRFTGPMGPTQQTSFVAWDCGAAGIHRPGEAVDIASVGTITALWGYFLTYSSDGGTGSPPARATYLAGADVIVAGQGRMTNPGYTFAGWMDRQGNTFQPGDVFTMYEHNTFLNAIWKCTLTYDANGATGDVTAPVIYDKNGSATVAGKGNLVNGSCTFVEWNTSPDGTGTAYDPGDTITMGTNITLYAVWRCTLTYDANGATGTVPEGGTFITGDVEIVSGDPGTLVMAGREFGGWNTSPDGTGITYTGGNRILLTDNVTLYAMWGHIVHFDLGGIDDNFDQFVFHGDKVTKPDMDYEDYDFKGWFTDSGFTSGYDFNTAITSATTINATNTLYAKWIVTVYFICNDDSMEMADQKQEFVYNTTDTIDSTNITLNDSTKYPNITGWNTRSDYSGVYYGKDELTPVTNMGLYAVWKYHVTYYSNGGRGDVPVDATSYNKNASATVLAKPENLVRNGCTFLEWNTEKDGTGTSYSAGDTVTVSNNIALYAIWTCGVTYNANGATGGSAPTDATVYTIDKSEVTVLGNTGSMVKTGCTFGGWNTRSDGSGTQYSPDDTFTIRGPTTLYAIWNCTLSYDKNGATGDVPESSACISGTSVVLKQKGNLEKTGYVFIGWEDESHDLYVEGDVYRIDKDTVMTAVWGHIVTFDNNGGTGVMTNQYVKDGTPTQLEHLRFSAPYGKEFSHWNTAPDDSGLDSYNDRGLITCTDDVVLYAIWVNTI